VLHGRGEVAEAGDALEAGHRLRGADGRANRPVRLVERRHGERDIECVRAPRAGEREQGLGLRDFLLEPLERGRSDTALLRRVRNGRPAGERVGDGELGARLARDPLVGVQAGERTTRSDVDEARRAREFRTRVGKVELLRNRKPPGVEEVGTE